MQRVKVITDSRSNMSGELTGKVALISGTGGGQGRAAALAFATAGATVVGCDLLVEGNQETARLVEAAGGTMTTSEPVDMMNPEQVKWWIDEAAQQHGGIDVMYNNAAATRWGLVSDMSLEDWHFTLHAELDTVFLGTKYAWPHLVKRGGGVVINVASVAGLLASDVGMGAHSAGKAGVMAFTRQAALEGAPVGIRAVSISPGPIVTPATDAHLTGEMRTATANKTLLRRWGNAEEVVHMAVFLASDKASYITGVNHTIDGGMTAF